MPVRLMRARYLKLFAVLFVLIVSAIVVIFVRDDSEAVSTEQRGKQSENFGTYRRITYNGYNYVEKPGITTILLLGVDKDSSAERTGYRSGGQSDFMMLVVIDDKNKTIRGLHIDRDTMADVTVLSITGKETGIRKMQLCLAHNFGLTENDNCRYTIQAIDRLLGDEYIDFYISGNFDSIGVFNDALQGVEVTLEDDFSMYDSEMVKGATLQLTREQAEIMVRARYNVDNGTNEMRMSRQRVYIAAALEKMKRLALKDSRFLSEFVDALSCCIKSNATMGRIINELSKSVEYSIMPIEYLNGTHQLGSNGRMEFIADETSVMDWVIDTYYRIELG